jgi:hypothetical protein
MSKISMLAAKREDNQFVILYYQQNRKLHFILKGGILRLIKLLILRDPIAILLSSQNGLHVPWCSVDFPGI